MWGGGCDNGPCVRENKELRRHLEIRTYKKAASATVVRFSLLDSHSSVLCLNSHSNHQSSAMAGAADKENVSQYSNEENVPLNEDGTSRVPPKVVEWAKSYVDSLMIKYPDVRAGAIIELSRPTGSDTNTILYNSSNFAVRCFFFTPQNRTRTNTWNPAVSLLSR